MIIKPKLDKSFHLLNFKACVGLLLLVYIFIYIIPPGLIPHSEHDHLGQIDKTLEADPCHIAMYHPGVLGACHHKYHLTKNHGNCLLCHVSLVRQIAPDSIQGIEFVYSISCTDIICPEGRVIHFPILHDDRGPPASSLS